MHYLHMWFRENLGLKVIAVFIACGLWAYVMVRENPVVVRELQGRVALRNVPSEYTVVESEPASARAVLSGPRRLVEGLGPSQIVLEADLTDRKLGENTVSLKPASLPPGVVVESLSPATVRVRLDKTATETRPLRVSLRGEPASGYTLGAPQPSRSEVEVSGAASVLAKVSQVVAEVDAAGLNSTVERTATVRALGSNGEHLEGVRVSPSEVNVVVPVTRGAQQTKTVPIRPQVGKPPAGYEVTEVTVRPAEVTVVGTLEALRTVTAVDTTPIAITSLTGTETYRAELVLPGAVRREGTGQVRVTVSVAKEAEDDDDTQPATPSPGPSATPPTSGRKPTPEPGPGPQTPPPGEPESPAARPAAPPH